MQWKLLIAALIILGVVAVMAFTEPGRKYTGFLSKYVGDFVAGIFNPEKFAFELRANKEAFYDQSFSFSGSTFAVSGAYNHVSIDGKVWESKTTKELNLNFAGSGKIELTKDGTLVVSATTSAVDLNDFTAKSDGVMDVNIEIVPSSFTLANLIQGEITLSSATGEIKKTVNNTVLTAEFTQSNIVVGNFNGSIQMENGTISLIGYATGVKSSDFKI